MKYNSGRFEKGHKMSNEVIKKISKALLGKKLSEDTKNKISEARKGIKFSNENKHIE